MIFQITFILLLSLVEALFKGMSPAIVPNIQLLCRELVDLLKTTERCQLLLSRFIPAYHHHFGRQCRVADYGYTKLVDLLESQVLSNVVQVNLGSLLRILFDGFHRF